MITYTLYIIAHSGTVCKGQNESPTALFGLVWNINLPTTRGALPYVPCDPAEAAGVCVKLPYEHTDEDGNTVKSVEDIVFHFPGAELLGMEQEATIEETSGSLLLNEAEEVVNILLGGGDEE